MCPLQPILCSSKVLFMIRNTIPLAKRITRHEPGKSQRSLKQRRLLSFLVTAPPSSLLKFTPVSWNSSHRRLSNGRREE
jgi:hypothetical protein